MGSSILGSLSPSLLGVEDDKSRTEDCQSVGERGCLAGPLYFIRMQLEPYGWQPLPHKLHAPPESSVGEVNERI